MKNKKLAKNKFGNFGFGLTLIVVSISITLFAFISEDNKITGFATASHNFEVYAKSAELRDFANVDSLGSLAQGNYYIGSNGVVYWIDDESRPTVGRLNIVEDTQKNRHIYIDDGGRTGYVLNINPIK